MGIAIIEPNVHGSSGHGKRFLTLDNGMLREDSVKDIGALLDWIAAQPDLAASRVLVTGGSCGGYMTLATAVHNSNRIVDGISVVGPSNFVSFLTHTESYRRDLRRVEYGDERDPAMRAFLEKIAPLSNAEKIRQPLFVVQGKNDPRVPDTESEQIAQRERRFRVLRHRQVRRRAAVALRCFDAQTADPQTSRLPLVRQTALGRWSIVCAPLTSRRSCA